MPKRGKEPSEELRAIALFTAKAEGMLMDRERPSCCGGGPQWGHDWDCPTLP